MDMQTIYARARLAETSVDFPHATAAQIAGHAPSLTLRFVQWADQTPLSPRADARGAAVSAHLRSALAGVSRRRKIRQRTLVLFSDGGAVQNSSIRVAYGLRRDDRAFDYGSSHCPPSPVDRPLLRHSLRHLRRRPHSQLISTSVFETCFPFFTFVQIATGCAAAICWRRRPRLTSVIFGLLWIGLATETLSAWPDYIAFFNFPAGGERGGIHHLGDSNLDWGQDLIGLARWQQQHKGVELYVKLEYSVDAKFYGLDYHEIDIVPTGPNKDNWSIVSDEPLKPGVIAVSATQLQGLYIKPWEEGFYERLRNSQPIAVIGGTVYIYRFNPP